MIYVDLIYNLAILIAMSVVSGFIDARYPRTTYIGKVLQGILFGVAAVIGMLRPFVMEAGLIFDGRSVLISLCGLFFGPISAAITCAGTIACRIYQGGPGATMGVLVILSSGIIGSVFYLRRKSPKEITTSQFLFFGLLVHLAMLAMTLALPAGKTIPTLKNIAMPVMIIYPLATILIGKILSDQEGKGRFLRSIRESEERFRAIFNSSFQFTGLLSRDGVVVEVNQTALDFVNAKLKDVVGIPFWQTQWWRDADKQKLRDSIALAADGQLVRYETENFDGDGKKIIIDFTLKPVFDADGKVSMVIAEGRDITAIKNAENQRRLLESQLMQSQKLESIGRLAGGVAHDFNNMLHTIIGYASLAMEELPPGSSLAKNIMEIQKAGEHSADLTRQLLAFARKQAISPKSINLNENVANMLKILRRLIGENIKLIWAPGEELWNVKMDATQLEQVLTNVVVNARDAIKDVGKIIIETKNDEFDQSYCSSRSGFYPGKFVALTISDTGCGIDKETQARIFEPFFTTKEVGKGSGLGLATVYGIVTQHNGFINVYSEPGRGTTLRIYFPRSEDDVAKPDSVESPPHDPHGTETVLLVEDERSLLQMGVRYLEKLGYKTLAADGPQAAMRLARSYPDRIHVMVTDVIMPIMSGRDLYDKLLIERPDLKCIYMSGYTANVISTQGVLDRDVYFLQKPFSIHEMARRLREVIDGKADQA